MGNTPLRPLILWATKDHPHIHGEYQILLWKDWRTKGSPPHTWGILSLLMTNSQTVRITPTYMGNTAVALCKRGGLQDHPHIHGEYTVGSQSTTSSARSPPHTWGIHQDLRKHPRSFRITPTYMGNTCLRCQVLNK